MNLIAHQYKKSKREDFRTTKSPASIEKQSRQPGLPRYRRQGLKEGPGEKTERDAQAPEEGVRIALAGEPHGEGTSRATATDSRSIRRSSNSCISNRRTWKPKTLKGRRWVVHFSFPETGTLLLSYLQLNKWQFFRFLGANPPPAHSSRNFETTPIYLYYININGHKISN